MAKAGEHLKSMHREHGCPDHKRTYGMQAAPAAAGKSAPSMAKENRKFEGKMERAGRDDA